MRKRAAAVLGVAAVAVLGAAAWFGRRGTPVPRPLTFTGVGGVERLALAPDGRALAEGSRLGQVTVFDALTGARRYVLAVRASSMIFSPDGRRLLTVARGRPSATNGTIQVWDAATGAALSRLVVPVGPPGTASSAQPRVAAFSSDLRRVAVRDPAHCTVYDLATGHQLRVIPAAPSGRGNVAFSRDGNVLAVGSDQGLGGLTLWDTRAWRPLAALGEQVGQISGVRFSPNGARLAFSTAAGLSWWDVPSRKRLGFFAAPKAAGHGLGQARFASDSGSLVFTEMGSTDTVHIVDCTTTRERMTLPNQAAENTPLSGESTSLSGDRAVTVLRPRPSQILFFHETYAILDIGRQREICRIAVPSAPGTATLSTLGGDWQVHITALSADGHVFAAGGCDDGIIHVWRIP